MGSWSFVYISKADSLRKKMGQYMSYPLQQEVICYHRRQDYDHCGNKKDIPEEINELDRLHREFCEDIFKQRMKTSERRKLLTEVSDESYAKRFLNWDAEDIGDFKIQFEVFDLNRDGLIDFKEMNMVLNTFGDLSTPKSWTLTTRMPSISRNFCSFSTNSSLPRPT